MSDTTLTGEKKIQDLKEIIRSLHNGTNVEEARRMLKLLVKQTDSKEIARMEQSLIDEGMPVAEVQSMCDLHSRVLSEILVEQFEQEYPAGHPADTMHRENMEILRVAARMRTVMDEILLMAGDADPTDAVERWRVALNEFMDIEKHYRRKENLFFSFLEKHGITGPSKVMWGKDDEARSHLKKLLDALAPKDVSAVDWAIVAHTSGEAAIAAIEEMVSKEENILLPMCMSTFTPEEWGEIHRQSPEYGWCLVAPATGYFPPDSLVDAANAGTIALPSGHLKLEQLLGIFRALPVDLTFVDAEDYVRFFSEGPKRIFERSRAIIGRKVQFCHPPKSVETVNRILDDFRAGRRDDVEFWIALGDKFVDIRYFAMRDEHGAYLGALEVTQDIAHLRKLEGERRLLSYES